MIKRTDRIYAPGELPEVGVLPYKMHAWTIREERLGSVETAFRDEIVDVPLPRRGEIIVANMAAGVNYNGVWAAKGKPKNVVSSNGNYGDEKMDFHICGSESSGIVYAVGEGVERLKPGDKVIVGGSRYDRNCEMIKAGKESVYSPSFHIWGYEGNWGAFAQFSRVMEEQCAVKPDNLSWAEAAALTATGVTAYRMLRHWKENQVNAGDVVLIYGGSGGIGSMAIQIVKYYGGIPVAVVSSDERGKLCEKLGAKGYINRCRFKHWGKLSDSTDSAVQKKWIIEAMKFKKAIWDIVGERKAPAIVIEHPGRDTFPTSLFVCDTNGMVVTCGATSSYLADIDLRFLWLEQKRIQGSHAGTRDDFFEFTDIVRKSNIKPLMYKEFPWEQLPQAHKMLCEGSEAYGRMTIKIGEK